MHQKIGKKPERFGNVEMEFNNKENWFDRVKVNNDVLVTKVSER